MNNIGQKLSKGFNRLLHPSRTSSTHLSKREGTNKKGQPIINDCLKIIFQFLTLKDLFRAHKVCKQWQNVSRNWVTLANKIRLVLVQELANKIIQKPVAINRIDIWIGFDPEPNKIVYISRKEPIEVLPNIQGTDFLFSFFLKEVETRNFDLYSKDYGENLVRYRISDMKLEIISPKLTSDQTFLAHSVFEHFSTRKQKLEFAYTIKEG